MLLNRYKVQEVEYNDADSYNTLYVDLIGFFLIAEIVRLFDNNWKEEIIEFIKNPSKKRGGITHGKRLRCSNKLKVKKQIIKSILTICFLNEIFTENNLSKDSIKFN